MVSVSPSGAKATSSAPGPGGSWMVTLPNMDAALTSTVTATDGKTTDTLTDVAIGDVLLCGGQSNMGFGMCGTTVIATGPHPQTPAGALAGKYTHSLLKFRDILTDVVRVSVCAALPTGSNPIRFFNQQGDRNGGAGSTVKGNVCKKPWSAKTQAPPTTTSSIPGTAL